MKKKLLLEVFLLSASINYAQKLDIEEIALSYFHTNANLYGLCSISNKFSIAGTEN